MLHFARPLAFVIAIFMSHLSLGQVPATAPLDGGLEKRLPEVRLENIPLADAIDELREISGSNVFVNWRALEGVGIDKTTPVSARLRDVTLARALRMILLDVGGGNVKLDFINDDGVIAISTEEDLKGFREAQPGEYYVAGVTRSGTYSLGTRSITLGEALRAAGVENAGKNVIYLRRDGVEGTYNVVSAVLSGRMRGEPWYFVIRPGDVIIVTTKPAPDPAAIAAAQGAKTFEIQGVAHGGKMAVGVPPRNLLQALVAGGENPAEIDSKVVRIHRDAGEGETLVYRSQIGELIKSPMGGPALEAGDRVVVSDR
jgi:hypothetical protein